MTEMFPILPLAAGQAVSIALTSYDGGVYFGVNGDRDAMPDIDAARRADRGVAGRARRAATPGPAARRAADVPSRAHRRRTLPVGGPIMRVYLPATTTDAARAALERASIGPAPLTAFAVTPGLREWYVDDDDEELEYAALDRGGPRLAAADRRRRRRPHRGGSWSPSTSTDAAVEVRDDLDRGVVQSRAPSPLAGDRVGPRRRRRRRRDRGRPPRRRSSPPTSATSGSQERVDDAEGFELSWYATQEIEALLDTV